MDVMSLEHNFGNEFQTSIKQLFQFFCNNFNLGQWESAKACLDQLISSNEILKFDLNQLLTDIILDPTLYCNGSDSIKSPFQLSLHLYEYCNEKKILKVDSKLKVYDEILLKHFLFTINYDSNSDNTSNKEKSTESINCLIDYFKTSLNANNLSNNTLFSDKEIRSFLINSLLTNIELTINVFKLLFKYNKSCELLLLKVHIDAIEEFLTSHNEADIDNLLKMLSYLIVYKIKISQSNEINALNSCFKNVCAFINKKTVDISEKEKLFSKIYSSLLTLNEARNDDDDDIDETSVHDDVKYLDLFTISQYENNKSVNFIEESGKYEILSIVKRFNAIQKRSYFWKYLFLYCTYEKKVLVQSIISECLNLIENNSFDNLSILLNVKEFSNLKPLILLLGITKVKDIQAAKRFIANLCINTEKNSLTDKLGNLFKTHIDFFNWFQTISSENRKKETSFADLVRLIHQELPLNIISQLVNVDKIEYEEMTKILRNTLTDKETSENTKWVRFMDEVNEKISSSQEACLFVYNGYFCISKILNSILYCCGDINKKLYLNKNEMALKKSNNTRATKSEQELDEELANIKKHVKTDYELNVIKTFENVRKIVGNINSVTYRLEILQNIYSLIYLMSNHFKEDESDDDSETNYKNEDGNSRTPISSFNQMDSLLNKLNEKYKSEQDLTGEQSIYADNDDNDISKPVLEKLLISKSALGGYNSFNSGSSKYETNLLKMDCSNHEYNKFIRHSAAGGGNFLCNEFIARDLLHLLKDLINDLTAVVKQATEQSQAKYLKYSSLNWNEMSSRLVQLQQLVNETLWRFQLVKSKQVSNDYGKVSLNILGTNPSVINEELFTYVIMQSTSLEKSDRKKSDKNSSTQGKRQRKISTKSAATVSSLTKLSNCLQNNFKQRTNLIIQKILSNKETLCAILLKENKFNEAKQLIKMYDKENDFRNSFEYKQVVYCEVFESTIQSLKEFNRNLKLNSNNYIDKSMLSIQINKAIDNLATISDVDQISYLMNICDLITVSNVNMNVCEYLNEYASRSLNIFEANSKGEPFVSLSQKIVNYVKKLQILVNKCLNGKQQNEANKESSKIQIDNITEFIVSFNCINFTSLLFDDVEIHFNLTIDLNSQLNNLKQTFEFEEEKRKQKDIIITSLIDKATKESSDQSTSSELQKKIKQHDLFLNMISLLKENSLDRKSILSAFFIDEFQQKSESDEEIVKTDINYLLSFYEYCKTMYEYFLDKNSLSIATNSYFSILNSPPSILICKLIFQDQIKPQLIETLTKRLNLNLTAILLHNSCPPLKLAQVFAAKINDESKALLRRESKASTRDYRDIVDITESLDLLNISNSKLELRNLDNNFYLNTEYLFYTILNKSDLQYCSLKKPDILIKDLLFKILKFIRKHSTDRLSSIPKKSSSSSNMLTSLSLNNLTTTVNLEHAANIYDSAEFKKLINETQELQHINLLMLKTNNQKLSFFINLYNLLSIHSNFYFASIRFKGLSANSNVCKLNESGINENILFNNLTEKLLFIQRMSYKVGQIGCISLFELKYIILNSNKFSEPILISKSNENKTVCTFKSDLINIEPLWSPYIPNLSENFYSNKVLFALVNCLESDGQICVYNSDNLLNDQLKVQMSLFLNNSVYVDLSEGLLFLPKIIVDHANFLKPTNRTKKLQNYKFENLINYLLENLNKTLSENLKSLIDLYSENYGENIDEFGKNELPFKIVELEESEIFLLNLELNENQLNSWFKKKIKLYSSKASLVRQATVIDTPLLATQPSLDLTARTDVFKQLNSDCLAYIEQNSPLISNSLGFLFDIKKQNKFFDEISQDENRQQNLLNRFIQLYVPLDYLKDFSLSKKLNLITQFLLINKTDEFKIELVISLANYYIEKSDWISILDLLNNCTQDNEEFNEVFEQQNTKLQDGYLQQQQQHQQQLTNTKSLKLRPLIATSHFELNNSKFTIRDLYNLYDYACVCCAYKESTINEKSYLYLFKMKNFAKQIRYCLSFMYLWPIDSCLEIVDYCLTRLKSLDDKFLSSNSLLNKYKDYFDYLNDIKIEFESYKVLTQCAKQTLENYFLVDSQNQEQNNESSENENEVKLKKICQLCLVWQTAKQILEAPSTSQNDNTIDLILNIFVLNNQFKNAKMLCKKLGLSIKFKFKLDYSHFKHRLLNLNLSNIINIIDLNSILISECITFANEQYEIVDLNNENSNDSNKHEMISQSFSYSNYDYYLFNICFQLLNELKSHKNVNNTIIVALTEYIFQNYVQLLDEEQLNELKLLELTAKIFNLILIQNTNNTQANDIIMIEQYTKHYSNPLYIIEQLLMNCKIDVCSKAINLCRKLLPQIKTIQINDEINKLLVSYADKALKFRFVNNNAGETAIKQQNPKSSKISIISSGSSRIDELKAKSPSSFRDIFKRSSLSNKSDALSSSFNKRMSLEPFATSPSSFQKSKKLSLVSNAMFENEESSFSMPLVPPTKDQWIKDEVVNECMVCNTERFTLLNRRHHCRRCGRIVCSNCSKNLTLINEIPQRTCDDCYKQTQRIAFLERRQSSADNDNSKESKIKPDLHFTFGFKKVAQENEKKEPLNNQQKNLPISSTMSMSSTSLNITISSFVDLNEQVSWQLVGEKEKDEEIRDKFRYQQAPSTALCLSILDLHDQSLECGKELIRMCDNISSYLQNTDYQVEDTSLIINMIKYLLCNAKVKLLQNSTTNIISLCDTYLSLIDILEQLLLANCSCLPSFNDLRNTESCRRIRNRLLEEERHELAMNLSTKCGLDSQTVWASWGLTELRRGNYKEARSKFDKCLKVSSDKSQSVHQSQVKILNDIISFFENAPPIRITGPETILAPLRSIDTLIAEPVLYCTDDSNMDDIQFKEAIYYLNTYGNHMFSVSFYQKHGYLQKALQYILENKCNNDVFIETLMIPSMKNGDFYQLLDYMQLLDRTQQKFYSYFVAIGKYLEKNGYLYTLYDFQLFMKDYIRACMSCMCFFSRNSHNYLDMAKNLSHLNKARQHLEQYLENCAFKTIQPQNLGWKQKSEQPSLCKQMAPKEVNNYLNAINLQIEVTKFLTNCFTTKTKNNLYWQIPQQIPTLFANNDIKINLCSLILLSGETIQDGFGFVIRIIQCFNLSSKLVYCQIASELAKQYNFKEIYNLLKCINESGYTEDLNASYDECISTCIRVFAASPIGPVNETTSMNTQQYNKDIDDLIQLIKDEKNKINAYILTGRLKSAYLIAIKMEQVDTVKHIASVAERLGQNLIKDICNKWVEKYKKK